MLDAPEYLEGPLYLASIGPGSWVHNVDPDLGIMAPYDGVFVPGVEEIPTPGAVQATRVPSATLRTSKALITADNVLALGLRATGMTPERDDTLQGTECPPDSLFAQPVQTSGWSAGVSDEALGWQRYESFSGVTGPICDVHWWGIDLAWDGGWVECTENPMPFNIIFYADDGGLPGAEVCSYTIESVPGAFVMSTSGYDLWEYEVVLDSCCNLSNGWVTIQGGATGDPGCYFLWMSSEVGDSSNCFFDGELLDCGEPDHAYDLSVCLTPGTYSQVVVPLLLGDPIADTWHEVIPPPRPPTGACCLPKAPGHPCFDDLTEAECNALGGFYHGDGTVCGPYEACCFGAGESCDNLHDICCFAQGGWRSGQPVCLGDNNGDGYDDACVTCTPTPPPLPDPKFVDIGFGTKNRYLTFRTDVDINMAIKIRIVYLPPPYDEYIGDEWWVTLPVQTAEASGSNGPEPPPYLFASTLTCAGPQYHDWSVYPKIDVYHAAIVPRGIYEVQAIADDCDPSNPDDYSDPLTVTMSKSGDIVGNNGCPVVPCDPPQGVVDFVDISSCVEKFKNTPLSPQKARADIIASDIAQPSPDRIVDFVDISCIVEAFRGAPCPLPGPQAHCP